MLEIASIAQLLQKLPLFYGGMIALLVLLILTRKNFTQPENIPQKNKSGLLALFIFVFGVVPATYLGWGFYQAYNPDYKYAEIASSVDFHLYQPRYIPPKLEQETAFHQLDSPLFDSSPTIRVHYGKSITQMTKDNQGQIIVVDQSKTPVPFSLFTYVETRAEKVEEQSRIEPVKIASFPNVPAYLLTNSIISTLWLHTNDGVLISIVSPTAKTPVEELIKIAESLH